MKIFDQLEPLDFQRIKKTAVYDRFLRQWSIHVREKLQGKTTAFDIDQLVPRKLTETDNQSEGKPVKQTDFKVMTTEVIVMTAKELGSPFMHNGSDFYVYDGTYLVKISEQNLNMFLIDSAIRLNVDRLLAPEANFVQGMRNQIQLTVGTEPKGLRRNMINLRNGTLEIGIDGSVHFRKNRFEDQFYYALDFDYDPNATCGKWDKFLDEVLPKKANQAILSEYLGSAFSSIKHEKLLLLFGTGMNGKSVVLDVLSNLLGFQNVANVSLEKMTQDNGYFLGDLMTAVLNVSGEISNRANPHILKQLASGEPLQGRHVRVRSFNVYNYCRSIFSANVLPKVTEASEGYFRRFLILPFEKKITKEQSDLRLAQKIASTDLPGILNWMILGLQRLLRNGGKFTESADVNRMLEMYREDSMSVSLFVDHMVKLGVGEMQAESFYAHYKQFCESMEYTTVSNKVFSTDAVNAGCRRTRSNQCNVYHLPKVQAESVATTG